jgi:hypothetical protein
MSGDGTTITPPGTSTPSASGPYLNCDFCKCHITLAGHVYKMSAEARAFQKLEETNTSLTEQLATVRAELATVTRERDEARAAQQRTDDDDDLLAT